MSREQTYGPGVHPAAYDKATHEPNGVLPSKVEQLTSRETDWNTAERRKAFAKGMMYPELHSSSPRWITTPPGGPGDYHWRERSGKVHIAHVDTDDLIWVFGVDYPIPPCDIFEWWSTRIEEPPR